MRVLKVAVIAADRHRQWRDEWCAGFTAHAGLSLHALELSTGDADVFRCASDEPPYLAVLVMVNADSVGWARNVLARLPASAPPPVLILRSLRTAVTREFFGKGAAEFVAWNCRAEELHLRLWRLACNTPARSTQAVSGTAVSTSPHPQLAGLIGTSPAFLQQLNKLPLLAACGAGVLILGETGTGKELCAQAVHYLSPRASHPWVAVNCGALPAELVESELFGHVRGAFTHAHETRSGLVAQAAGGTLFLDEVDSMPAPAQVKLLRFLQDKEFRPVGSSRTQQADVRVIAASNGNLAQLAASGAFRSDLYYRLNVLTLSLPPLRDRVEDLLPLAQHFVHRFASEFKRPVYGLSAAAGACITAYRWPGNIRELQHAIERGVLLAPGKELLATDLGIPMDGAVEMADATGESFHSAKARAVELFERAYIERLLARCSGNITRAANAASKNRRAFWELMRKHGIDSAKYRPQ
jgi:two-component system, NtrC family, response regulator GlrR